MNYQLSFFAAFLLFFQFSFAAEILVKTESITVAGYSAISTDKLTIYGGIAGGNEPVTGDSGSTVNTCDDPTASVKACNQVSVHSALKLTITFQTTKDVSNALARMYIDNGGSYIQLDSQTVSVSASSGIVTLETTWGEICNNAGLSASCTGSTLFATKNLKVGVDSDASGDVEDAERKTFTIKLHYISAGDVVSQSYCPVSASGSGMCNLALIPGDAKVYIDSAIYAGNDPTSGSFEWESIAVFPVATASGNEVNTLTNFTTSLAEPIFKNFDATDGTIPDSAVSSGNLENYQQYCFVYGTKNVAQNIYKFVTDAAAVTTACKTPSEVVGVLEDKSCFISTAAFGSDMAPEVKTFRAFRNKFLLTNFVGKYFVKTYYKLSPPVASWIAESSELRAVARTTLYPFLFFAKLALQFGFWTASLLFILLLLGLRIFLFKMQKRKVSLLIILLFLAPVLKAEVKPNEKIISHENAKEGLIKITKDGTYVYDIVRPLKSESSKITFGVANQPDITIDVTLGNGNTNTYNFQDFYSESSGMIVGYDYEKYPWMGLTGKLGYQLGASLMLANGHGILVSDGTASAESYTFLTMPINAGAVYRFEYKDKQMLAPYVSGGGTLLALLEKRDDNAKPNLSTGFGFYGAGGLLFNVTALDPDAGFELDSEYGISNLWLSLEFRLTEVNNGGFSFSNQYVNAGLSFDF